MKKVLGGLLIGLLIGGGLMYFLPKFNQVSNVVVKSVEIAEKTDMNTPAGAEFNNYIKHLKDCGEVRDFASEKWFTSFLTTVRFSKIELYAIADACYLKDQDTFFFIYWAPTLAGDNPGYGDGSGIYKYDIQTSKLDIAVNDYDKLESYDLPFGFDKKNDATKFNFSSGALAWGCEPDDLDPTAPCCGPNDGYYEYDVVTNTVKLLYLKPSQDPDPRCHMNDVVNKDGITIYQSSTDSTTLPAK